MDTCTLHRYLFGKSHAFIPKLKYFHIIMKADSNSVPRSSLITLWPHTNKQKKCFETGEAGGAGSSAALLTTADL